MKSYLRFLGRNKLYTAIMAVGLSVSLAFVIIFTCYVRQQMAVCNHYPDSDRIYLVGMFHRSYSYYSLAQELETEIPEVEEAVLVQNFHNPYTFEGELSSQKGMLLVSKDFFDIFKTKFIYGSPEDFNTKTNAFVSESFAKRHGMMDVIGKKLKDGDKEFVIAGIIEDFSSTIFEDFEIILNADNPIWSKGDNSMSSASTTFIKVREKTDMEALHGKITDIVKKFLTRTQMPREADVTITRLDKLYLSNPESKMSGFKTENGDRLIIFCIVVIFLLISAIINYVNLNVANAENRAKEIGIRHIMGEERNSIVGRIFKESLVFIIICFVFAIGLAFAMTDVVNDLIRSTVPISLSFTWDYIAIYCMIALFIASLCGLFVSLTTSKVKISSTTRTRLAMSKFFIGLQSVLSFIMISAAITMEVQMKYMLNRDMNANTDNVYYTNYTSSELSRQLEQLPFVRDIGQATGYPGYFGMTLRGGGDAPSLAMMYCDSIAFRIFDFNIVEQFSGNSSIGTWMSEKAANHYNVSKDNPKWDAPGFGGITETVSGTIMDTPSTNILNLDLNGLPLINVVTRESLTWGGYVVDVEETKEHKHVLDSLVSAIYLAESGRELFKYGFIRDLNKAEYDQTLRDMRLIEMFMFISIMLSCLAFLAMSMHYASGNTKQISVHKVFGGTTRSELMRCMKVYFRIMVISVIIGLPPAIWISGRYLEQFSYKFRLAEKWWIFLVAVLLSLLISTGTVLWQTLRAARTNPAEALKKE